MERKNVKVNHKSYKKQNDSDKDLLRWLSSLTFYSVKISNADTAFEPPTFYKYALTNYHKSRDYRNYFMKYAVDTVTPNFIRVSGCLWKCEDFDACIELSNHIDLTCNKVEVV